MLLTPGLGTVEVSSPAVLAGDAERVETRNGMQRLDELRRLPRPVRHLHIRQDPRHESTLGRIVVDEHDGIEAQAELLGDLSNTRRLVAPVDAP